MAKIWRWTVGGTDASGQQLWMSTMHYQTDGSPGASEPDAEAVLNNLCNHYGTGGGGFGMERWLVVIPPSVKLTFARTYEELAPASADIPGAAVRDFTLSGAAAVGENIEPFALCPWMKFTTGLASRSSRGGTHLAPALASFTLDDGGLFDTATAWWSAVDDLGGFMIDRLNDPFGGDFTAVDLQPVIYSRTRRARGETPFTFDITNYTPSPVPRFLRRRDVGR
jgi:hypothetical protein